MKATMVATDVITSIDGVPCRIWKGETEGGVPFVAFIHRVAVDHGEDTAQFERELVETGVPREMRMGQALEAFSTRML